MIMELENEWLVVEGVIKREERGSDEKRTGRIYKKSSFGKRGLVRDRGGDLAVGECLGMIRR